ncbi:cold shock domain-containing protein [Dactylosporangium sp. NPDC049525]|uniref:protein kinase domain-containing protein n=1 Tax=Dactylosporangium sp. NPDC049525 TaxID=3154730 RepID=UPI0034136026
MVQGFVKWWNSEKGFGFITQDFTKIDIFAHYSKISTNGYRELVDGQRVEFDIIQGQKGPIADNIRPIQSATAQAAGRTPAGTSPSVAQTLPPSPASGDRSDVAPPRNSGASPAGFPLERGDPRTIDSYTLVSRLGEGAMGTVYLARDQDGSYVALKVIRADLAHDAVFLRRFDIEAQHAARLDATYTAKVIKAVTDGPIPYLATEFIQGPTLEAEVARSGPLSAANAKALAIGSAAALISIHDAGIVHRDLKPSNVMLSYFGPRVIDFGIARSLSSLTRHTRVGAPVGTPMYMSPEQFQEQEVTSASDIFSWAGMIVFAATGHPPFGDEDTPYFKIMFQIIDGEPSLAGVPRDLIKLVEAGLSKMPSARPAARQILASLVGGSAGDPAAAADRAIGGLLHGR